MSIRKSSTIGRLVGNSEPVVQPCARIWQDKGRSAITREQIVADLWAVLKLLKKEKLESATMEIVLPTAEVVKRPLFKIQGRLA